jgi:diacylglycerol kinase family enzyme
MGTQTPLAILPGGTANLLAVELGISKKLEEAAQLLIDPQAAPRWIDAGQVGDKIFLLRVGVGFSAARVKYADRSMKDRFGMAAYSLSAVKSSIKTKASDFRLTLDGQIVEIKAMTCLIDNAGNMGKRFARAASGIDISDGLLDVLVVHSEFEELKSGVPGKRSETGLNVVTDHWQAAHIEIEATPPQPVQVDGEMVNDTPLTIQVLPKALRVLAPAISEGA